MNQQDTEDKMHAFANALQEFFPDFLFTLVLHHREAQMSNYISNGQRADVIRAMREMADKLEADQDLPAIDPNQPAH